MRQRKIWAVLSFCLCVAGCGGGGGGAGNSGERTFALSAPEFQAVDIAGTVRATPSATIGALEAI
jgi:hypothetical protein